MSSGTHMEMDWAGSDAAHGGAGVPPAGVGNDANGAAATRYLTDEEILGLQPIVSDSPRNQSVILSPPAGEAGEAKNLSSIDGPRNDTQTAEGGQGESAQMPDWMQSAAADPRHGAEAAQLWREHQEFRAAFASPEEARAVKELLPGGVSDVLSLREATQSVERIDAALFSADARAQAEVVSELARANPAAFRSLFAEAAKVLAGLGERGKEAGSLDGSAANEFTARPTLRENREGWGTRKPEAGGWRLEAGNPVSPDANPAPSSRASNPGAQVSERQASVSSLRSPASNLQNFDPVAYAAFERSTNDAVARDVRGSISDTLARVLPEGVAEGAARRIGDDIFHEIHRALAADRTLSEQVAAVLRPPSSAAADGYGGPRFGAGEQQRASSLLAGRAKQLVPSVARRVIGEWTSSVLNTSRSKAARQAAAASRVDIAAPGGSLDSMPLRQMSPREVNYASMSDEEILGI